MAIEAIKHQLYEPEKYEWCAACSVCGGFEGSLLSFCPGYKLNEETLDAIYRGNVIDFLFGGYRIAAKIRDCDH